jgi:hypothetical protein
MKRLCLQHLNLKTIMKNLKLHNLLLLVLLAATFTACNKDDDTNNGDTAAEGQLVATIDGESYSSSSTNAGATFINGIFNVTAMNSATNEVITITVENASEGTFGLGPASGNGAAYTINQEDAFLSNAEGGSGTITITKLDTDNKLASGSFEFIGTREFFNQAGEIETESVAISGGSFTDLTLVTEITGNANSTLNVDIDGTAFNPDAVTGIRVTFQGQNSITISAIKNSTSETVGITLPGDISPGTYNFDSLPLPGAIIAQYSISGGNQVFVSIDGSITIDTFDEAAGVITGTFEFTAGDFLMQDPTTYAFTNGEFDVELQ